MGVRQELITRLWHGNDPYADFTPMMPADEQGWNSDHPYLPEAIDRYRPGLVVEVGVWKGASVFTMARRMRAVGCDGVVLAVDTWLGSREHWLHPTHRLLIGRQHGFPLLYFQFLSNVVHAGLQEYVLPLPLDSANAAEVVRELNLAPVVIHLDAGHDYASVTADLERWWPRLAPGGMLIADDYDATGVVWTSVGRAIDDFSARTPHEAFAAQPYKCRFVRPGTSA